MSWVLKEVTGSNMGSPVPLISDKSYVFGRKVGAFMRLDSVYASRRHCTIKIKQNSAFITDHKTLNGTFIGSLRVPAEVEVPLTSGDRIGIGLAPNEFSSEPFFIITNCIVEPEVIEIQDTCEVDATLPYLVDKIPAAVRKTDRDCFLEPGYALRRDDDSFRVPAPVTKKLSLSKVKRESSLDQVGPKSFDPPCDNRNVPQVDNEIVFKSEIESVLPSHSSPVAKKNDDDVIVIGPTPSPPDKSEVFYDAKKEFSMCDDIIVINSDDDEDDLPCSQFFNVSKREKEFDENSVDLPIGVNKNDMELVEGDAPCPDISEDLDESSLLDFFEEDAHNISKMIEKEFGDEEKPESDGSFESPVENVCPQSDLSLHSQLSPETYLSRVNNEIESVNKEPIIYNENVLESLMTQQERQVSLPVQQESRESLTNLKECQVNLLDFKNFANNLIRLKDKTLTSSITSERVNAIVTESSSSNEPSTVSKLKSPKSSSKSSSKEKTKKSNKRSNDLCVDVDEPKSKTSRISFHPPSPEDKESPTSKSSKPCKRKSSSRENQIKRMIEAGKKLDSSISSRKISAKPTKDPYNFRPSEKRKIRELRKKKLHEVALNKKLSKEPETEEVEVNASAPLVNNEEIKTSETGKSFVKNTDKNRGAVLIDMIPQKSRVRSKDKIPVPAKNNVDNAGTVQSSRKTRSKSKDVVAEHCKENERRNVDKDKGKPCVQEEEEKGAKAKRSSLRNLNKNLKDSVLNSENIKNLKETENKIVIVSTKRKSILKARGSIGSLKTVKFASNERLTLVKYYEKDDPELVRGVNSAHNYRRTVYVKGAPKTVDSLIYLFCKWNPKWIEESMHTEGLPPLMATEFPNPSPVVTSYESYHEYQNTLLPLQVLELWDTIVRDTSQKKQSVCVGAVRNTSESRDKMMENISVTSYMQDGDDVPKQGDLVIVKGIDKSLGDPVQSKARKGNMWLSFGYIPAQLVKKPLQHSDKASLDSFRALCASGSFQKSKAGQVYTVSFQVLVRAKTMKFWRPGMEISIAPCVNLLQHLKPFMTLERLIFCPLASLILNPATFQLIENASEHSFKQQQSLNKEQQRAVNYCTKMVLGQQPSIALIHGPPGTGKSVVITHLLLTVLDELRKDKHRMRLLVCAPSNFAVDQLVSRLLSLRHKLGDKNKFNMVRVGNNEMMSDDGKLVSLKTLSEKMLEQFSKPEVAKVEIEKLSKREKYLKSLLDCGNNSKQEALTLEINDTKRYMRELELFSERKADKGVRCSMLRRYERDLLLKSDIVATTLCSSVSSAIQINLSSRESKPFGFCVVDEATQASELQCLLPILLNVNKFVLVGDDKQLSPVVTSQKAKSDGLEFSLFERLLKCWKENPNAPIFPLVRQYRMHPEIISFPNKSFYAGTLISEWSKHKIKFPLTPYLVFSHNFRQESDGNSNIEEGEFVLKLINALKRLQDKDSKTKLSIAIITPYQAQREFYLRKTKSSEKLKDVNVMTVDSAQGQERDVIVFSCVRSHNIGFMSDSRRLNVALTRAKHALYVVANFSSLKENHVWRDLLHDSHTRKLVFEMKKTPSSSVIENLLKKGPS